MDKQIRKIEKDVKHMSSMHKKKHDEKKMGKEMAHVGKELKSLEKMDKKHDKLIHKAKKKMKRGC